MTKKRSKCLFILFAILLVIGLVATFVNFTYPLSVKGNYYSYSNFVENIKLGEDISSGLRITYRADLPDYEQESNYQNLYNKTIEDLKEILQGQGFKDVTVAGANNNQIIVNVGNIVNEADKNEVVSLLGDMSQICFSLSSNKDEAFATAQDIEKIETLNVASDKTYFYVRVSFKSSSMPKIEEATKDGGSLSIILGDTTIGSMEIESSTLANGYLDIYSEDFVDQATANTYANKLKTGTFALQLIELENSIISASYGAGANIYLSVAIAVLVVAVFAYLIYKFKHMGWISSFAMMFFLVLSLFLLQSVPLVHVNFGGILGFVLAFVVAADTIFAMIDKAETHYQSDVKLFISFKMAQKETLFRTLISNVILLLAGFICMFMPQMAVQSFGWVVFVMSFVSAFTSLVLMKLFIKMYLPLNNNNGSKCNFHKGGKNA